MARCRKCNLVVGTDADRCPRCGNPLPAHVSFSTLVVGGIAVVILFAALRSAGWIKFDANQVAALPDNRAGQHVEVSEAERRVFDTPPTSNSPPVISALVPRGNEKASFDCAKAKRAAARLICADAELTRLDGDLGIAFQKRKAQIPPQDQSRLVTEELAWISERDTLCKLVGKDHASIDVLASAKSCMVSETQRRITALMQTQQVSDTQTFDANRVAEELRKRPSSAGPTGSFDDATSHMIQTTIQTATRRARACVRSHIVTAYQAGVYGPKETTAYFFANCGVEYLQVWQSAGGPEELGRLGFEALITQEVAPEEWQKTVKEFERAAEQMKR
jgi:uncharacterized protein YecT (DUF1311 family)